MIIYVTEHQPKFSSIKYELLKFSSIKYELTRTKIYTRILSNYALEEQVKTNSGATVMWSIHTTSLYMIDDST